MTSEAYGDRETIRRILTVSAPLITRLHRAGLVHRDLYLSHLFFDAAALPQDAFRLIDLQRVFRPRWRLERWIVKDLAALNFSTPSRRVSRADRLRWLRTYLGGSKLDARARRLVYRILGRTQRLHRRESARRT